MIQFGLPLDWPGRSGADFLTSDANAVAVRHLENWRDWPVMTSILTGPALSGRSTLGRHFARQAGARVIDDAWPGDEEALFHAWNRAQDERRPLLLIADAPPALWTIALPDLRSRVGAAPHVALAQPDEALAIALIERGLMAAGAPFAADVPTWVGHRVERDYRTIAAVIDALNAHALSSGRKISAALAKEALQMAGILPIEGKDRSD